MSLNNEKILEILKANETTICFGKTELTVVEQSFWNTVARQILSALQPNSEQQPQLQQTDCSTSLPLAQLYSFAEKLASGDHEWRYNEKDGLWHKDGWVSRTTDELMQLFPERL